MKRRRILLVSADPDFLIPYTEFLRFVGYDVVSTPNADEALRVAASSPIDLVVTDFPTLSSSGRPVAAELRGGSSTHAMPILCLTSHVVGAELSQPYDAGATLVFPMPMSPRDLALAVENTLHGQRDAGTQSRSPTTEVMR